MEDDKTLYKEYKYTQETKIEIYDDNDNINKTIKKLEEYTTIKFVFIDYNNKGNYFNIISVNLKDIEIINNI